MAMWRILLYIILLFYFNLNIFPSRINVSPLKDSSLYFRNGALCFYFDDLHPVGRVSLR